MSKRDVTIIAWKKLSRRSELLSNALDAKLWFFPDRQPYLIATVKTFFKVVKEKPKNIIIQLPQGPLLLEALILKKISGCKVIADVHTGFLINTEWKGLLLNAPYVKFLSDADLITAHNPLQIKLVPKKAQKKTITVYDQWQKIKEKKYLNTNLSDEEYIVFPASFASDEPLEEIIKCINRFDINIKMYVTGNWKRRPDYKKYFSKKIIFTGFLSDEEYNNLLKNSKGIITGTKREYTTLMSAWEAVAYEKPLILTDNKTLREIYQDYAIYYNFKKPKSILKALKTLNQFDVKYETLKKLQKNTEKSLERLKKHI